MATVEELYKTLGQAVVSIVPKSWQTVTITFTFDTGSIAMNGFYTKADDPTNKPYYTIWGSPVRKAMTALRKALFAAGSPTWYRATYTLHPDGNFRLDFDYDYKPPVYNEAQG